MKKTERESSNWDKFNITEKIGGSFEDWKKSPEIRKELDSCFEWKDYQKILSEYGIIEIKLNSLDKLTREKIIEYYNE